MSPKRRYDSAPAPTRETCTSPLLRLWFRSIAGEARVRASSAVSKATFHLNDRTTFGGKKSFVAVRRTITMLPDRYSQRPVQMIMMTKHVPYS